MADLDSIKTVFLLMMENRSFDHMLGYLSLPPFNRADVDGQSTDRAWLAKATNTDQGRGFQPFLNKNPYRLPPGFDPPHQRENVTSHLGELSGSVYPMNGFVSALPASVSTDPDERSLVMSYFGAEQVPITHFFEQNFTFCDRWFCSLPSGTQHNRLMAMSGSSAIDSNQTPLPGQPLVYDWLNEHGISWRVYHQGIPFFTMMPHWIPEILGQRLFRSFEDLQSDLTNTPADELPQVIFIEPVYGDAPHIGRSTDDHAPAGISDGQEFLMQAYNAVSFRRSVWKNSLLVVSYDEHGGFFDHVSPPMVPTKSPAGRTYDAFESLGPRTPAHLISPFVKPGFCAHNPFDHTSILKFLGEKFNGGSYSDEVDSRDVESLSAALDFTNPIVPAPTVPPVDAYLSARPPKPALVLPPLETKLQIAFRESLEEMKRRGAGPDHPKFGELIQKVPPPS